MACSLDAIVDHWLADEENAAMAANPSADGGELALLALTQFAYTLRQSGHDLGSWDEQCWAAQFPKFGIGEGLYFDAMETLASEGMTDNFVWEQPPLAE